MGYSKLYDDLINKAEELVKYKSDEELYELGKKLSFTERTMYDYKIKSVKENFKFSEVYAEYCNKRKMIDKIIEHDELDYIIKNFKSLLSYNIESFVDPILKYLKENTSRMTKEELEELKHSIIYNMLIMQFELDEIDINRVKALFEDIVKDENLSLFDIKRINEGSYSRVYKVGNKVIKIGKKRATDKIVDNNRILLPDEFIFVKSNIIEITDYIEGLNSFTEDEIYEVYKELRDQGIIWLDPTSNNLRRANEKIIAKQEEKSKHRDKYPFISNRRLINRPMKLNEPIIIDLDHLVDENNSGKIEEINDYLREDILSTREKFEKRYLLEKKKTIN